MVVGAFRDQLVLDLDRREAGRLARRNRAPDMHRVAPAAGAVEDQRQVADGADVERRLGHLGQRQIGFGAGLDVAHRAATEIQRLKPGGLGQQGRDRVEYERRIDRLRPGDQTAEFVHLAKSPR
jgi:hypothetical protein